MMYALIRDSSQHLVSSRTWSQPWNHKMLFFNVLIRYRSQHVVLAAQKLLFSAGLWPGVRRLSLSFRRSRGLLFRPGLWCRRRWPGHRWCKKVTLDYFRAKGKALYPYLQAKHKVPIEPRFKGCPHHFRVKYKVTMATSGQRSTFKSLRKFKFWSATFKTLHFALIWNHFRAK